MYGKIYEDIFQSTLADLGGDTIYVLMSMVVLSDSEGYLRMTVNSLAHMIRKSADIVQSAIEQLEQDDPESSTPDYSGKRIIKLSTITNGQENRGWWIVNKQKYSQYGTKQDRRKQNREAQQRFRDKYKSNSLTVSNDKQSSAPVSTHKQPSAPVSTHKHQSARKVHDYDNDYDNDNDNNPLPPRSTEKTKSVVPKRSVSKSIVFPPKLNHKSFQEFLDYRKISKFKTLQIKSVNRLIIWLIEQGDKSIQEKIINETIRNGWQGLFTLKESSNETDKRPRGQRVNDNLDQLFRKEIEQNGIP